MIFPVALTLTLPGPLKRSTYARWLYFARAGQMASTYSRRRRCFNSTDHSPTSATGNLSAGSIGERFTQETLEDGGKVVQGHRHDHGLRLNHRQPSTTQSRRGFGSFTPLSLAACSKARLTFS